jgi:CRP/FNR family transcriptional regulator, cyclic AMP receptor protein
MDEARLKDVTLFASLSRSDREFVARQADEVDVETGKTLIAEGELGYEFFVVEEGAGEVTRDGAVIDTIGPGDFVGEMALLEQISRNATVVATSPMRLIVITGPSFRHIEREMPAVAEQIRAAVAERAAKLGSG